MQIFETQERNGFVSDYLLDVSYSGRGLLLLNSLDPKLAEDWDKRPSDGTEARPLARKTALNGTEVS